jgi:hypothetical protein
MRKLSTEVLRERRYGGELALNPVVVAANLGRCGDVQSLFSANVEFPASMRPDAQLMFPHLSERR